MTGFRQNGRNIAVALAAACALVLQLMASVQAAPVQFDIFGNPLCVTGTDGSHGSPSNGGGHRAGDCCLLGCGVSVSGPPPAPAALAVRWPRQTPAVFAAVTPVAPAAPAYRRGNPRAPPLTV
jgi:hypothetical protein